MTGSTRKSQGKSLSGMVKRAGYRSVTLGGAAVLVAGCSFGGLNSLDMPGTKGHGSGSYTITVELPDVATLPQNSPVMVDDVTVGSVSGIDAMQRPDGTFYAAVKVSLDGDVHLPSNATARVAQTSLLGSQHIELSPPATGPAEGRLTDGANIPEAHSGRYPTTEEVLSSLGVVVNKGNLGALQDITDEAYAAVAGRAGSFTDLVPKLAQLADSLAQQTDDIIAAAEGLNRFAGILASNKDSLGRALDTLPAALKVLNANRTNIVDAFAALGRLGVVAADVLAKTKVDFAADFKDLFPVIKALNDHSDAFIKDLEFLPTFPFHYKYLRQAVRGDYLNVFVTFDLTLRRLGESVLTTSSARSEHEAPQRGRQPTRHVDRCHGEPVRSGRRPVQNPARHRHPDGRTTLMLDRLSRIQLTIFALVTVLAVGAISLFYLHLPAKAGLGTYKVDANFVAGGGIYPNANVTYRGVTIGRVDSVGLTDDGVIANMRLNSNTPVPDNVTATVKSVSAVGEQYIDLVPPKDASRATLHNGASIGQDRTAVGQDIEGLLKQADQLVGSIDNSRLQDLLRETFKAFNGSGPELARMIQSSRLLVDEANANSGQTTQLIDQAGPFLDAQIRSGDNIKALADGLARFTTELNNADPQVRALLQTAPGAAGEVNTAFTGIRPNFPMLAANLANLGRIGVIYHKSIEQALVIFPALLAALDTVAGGVPTDEGGKLDFKVDLGDPPTATSASSRQPDPLARRRNTARSAHRHVLQDGAERPGCGPRRAQLSLPGIPRQARTHRPALP